MTENEKKKTYLKSYRESVKREQEILEEIQRLRMDKMFPSVANDGMPIGGGHSDLSDYMVILDRQIQALKKERLERVKIQEGIDRGIRRMSDADEQRVLRLRYIKGMKWEAIAVDMGYSWQHVHKIHARALNNFIR